MRPKHISNQKLILSWTAVLLWLVVIFWFSAQPATQSDGLSKEVTKVLVVTIAKTLGLEFEGFSTVELVNQLNHLVRKNAHGIAYFILGVLVLNGLRRSRVFGYKGYLYAFLFTVFYAATDEVHQMFVPGRGPMVTDVLIDAVGALIGLVVYRIVAKCIR